MALLPRRKLGNTGIELSVIGFGASPLGGIFGVREGCAGQGRRLLTTSHIGVGSCAPNRAAQQGSSMKAYPTPPV